VTAEVAWLMALLGALFAVGGYIIGKMHGYEEAMRGFISVMNSLVEPLGPGGTD